MKKKLANPQSFIINLGIIILFGLIILSSTTAVVGFVDFGSNYYYLNHQILFGLLPGLALFFLCSKIPYKFWKKNAGLIFIISFLLLLAVFIPGIGQKYNQAQSWLNIAGFSLQPAEIMKLALIIYLSALFSKNIERKKNNNTLVFISTLLIVGLPIIFQPDIGTLLIIALIAFALYFIAGAKWSHIFGLMVLGGVAVTGLIFSASYRLNRFLAFLNPDLDPQGVGYHINQALVAVGSGGWFGMGLGKSRQKFEYLPEVAGDSIFAVMAEEIGFIFVILFLFLLFSLIFKILKTSRFLKEDFAKLFTIGLAVWIGGQSIINIGAMLGILPLTGVPLPFISYGGTSLMTLMAGCGIFYNVIHNA